MPGARSVLHPLPDPVKSARMKVISKGHWAKKTEAQQLVIQNAMAERGGRDLTTSQVNGLARGLKRSKEAIKEMVQQARENFVAAAEDYVGVHLDATKTALANGDPKSLEVATRAAQWAMENLSVEGARVIEKAAAAETGNRIYIGVNIGGLNDSGPIVEAKVLGPGEPQN